MNSTSPMLDAGVMSRLVVAVALSALVWLAVAGVVQ